MTFDPNKGLNYNGLQWTFDTPQARQNAANGAANSENGRLDYNLGMSQGGDQADHQSWLSSLGYSGPSPFAADYNLGNSENGRSDDASYQAGQDAFNAYLNSKGYTLGTAYGKSGPGGFWLSGGSPEYQQYFDSSGNPVGNTVSRGGNDTMFTMITPMLMAAGAAYLAPAAGAEAGAAGGGGAAAGAGGADAMGGAAGTLGAADSATVGGAAYAGSAPAAVDLGSAGGIMSTGLGGAAGASAAGGASGASSGVDPQEAFRGMEYGGDYGGAASPGYTGYGANGQGIPSSVNLSNAGGTMSTSPMTQYHMPQQQQQSSQNQRANFFDPSLDQRPTSLQLANTNPAPGFWSIASKPRNPYAIGLMGMQDA